MTPTPLGTRLHTLRSLVPDLSQRELARLAKVSKAYPAHIEGGLVKDIGTDIASRLSGVLGCTTEYLLLGSGDAPTEESVRAAVAAAQTANPKPARQRPEQQPPSASTEDEDSEQAKGAA